MIEKLFRGLRRRIESDLRKDEKSQGIRYWITLVFEAKTEPMVIKSEWFAEVIALMNQNGCHVDEEDHEAIYLSRGDTSVFRMGPLPLDAATLFKMRYGGTIQEGELIWRPTRKD